MRDAIHCSAIIRFPLHDGLPLGVLEFITAGRYAVTSVPIKGSIHIPNDKFSVDAVISELRKLQNKKTPNKASKYWQKELNHDLYRKRITEITGYEPKKYWENRAKDWDIQATDEPFDTEEIKKVIDSLPEKPKSILDMGCGNGKWFPLLSQFGEYEGFDISSELIKIAMKKHSMGNFFTGNVETYKSDKKFDLAFSYTVLEHIVDKDFPKAVENIKKLAKYILLVEPENFTSRYYCHNHDYRKHFDVINEFKLKDKTIMLCSLN